MADKTDRQTAQKQKCTYCEFDGIVHNPYYDVQGESPLIPCERCVLPDCKCGGVAPYYIFEDGKISDCPCRSVRMRIERIKNIYNRSGIDRYFKWKFLGNYDANRSRMASEAKNAATK